MRVSESDGYALLFLLASRHQKNARTENWPLLKLRLLEWYGIGKLRRTLQGIWDDLSRKRWQRTVQNFHQSTSLEEVHRKQFLYVFIYRPTGYITTRHAGHCAVSTDVFMLRLNEKPTCFWFSASEWVNEKHVIKRGRLDTAMWTNLRWVYGIYEW